MLTIPLEQSRFTATKPWKHQSTSKLDENFHISIQLPNSNTKITIRIPVPPWNNKNPKFTPTRPHCPPSILPSPSLSPHRAPVFSLRRLYSESSHSLARRAWRARLILQFRLQMKGPWATTLCSVLASYIYLEKGCSSATPRRARSRERASFYNMRV